MVFARKIAPSRLCSTQQLENVNRETVIRESDKLSKKGCSINVEKNRRYSLEIGVRKVNVERS